MPFDYSTMLGMPPAEPQVAPPIADVIQPDPIMAEIAVPASSPEELAARKSGWEQVAQRVQTDPNLRRAMLFAGISMMQPKPIGQTTLGALGQAMMSGASAFQLGEAAQVEQDIKLAKERRAEEAHTADIAEKKARLPGVQAESKVKAATVDDLIAQTRIAREKAEFELQKALSVEEVEKVERELRKRKAEVEASIPDDARRKAILAELEAAALAAKAKSAEIALKQSQAAQAGAAAAESRADTALKQVTVKELESMPPEERRQFLTKSGKYAGATSGIVQQAELWGKIYDRLPATDPNKAGKTREQFQMEQLKSAKAEQVTGMLKNYVMAGGDDPEVISGLGELIKQEVIRRKPPAPAPAASGGEGWKPYAPGLEYRLKPDGTREVRRAPTAKKPAAEAPATPDWQVMSP